MKEELIHKALVALECESQITRILLAELIAQSPDPELLLSRFQQAIESMVREAPKDVDQEMLVELRARAAQTDLIARRTLLAASRER
ncbi:hypothetical protein [Comamonas testosteroni]|uniref:hypothetical protein n=1 Tax=Comamonas testosteroni TaxID=285 RepID=UPI0028E93070|nr:hypothetical protein [Comamonas testosteroni]